MHGPSRRCQRSDSGCWLRRAGFLPGASEILIEPEVILSVITLPLLYAAALHVPFVDFRRNLQVIAYLALVLVVVSAFAVGALVDHLWPAVGFAIALAHGAVVAPPDAVAVTSIGKRLGLPPRIVTILEGEGLVNDATALVLLSTAVGVATSGEQISAGGVIGALVASILGALVVRWIIGRLAVAVRAHFDDIVLDAGISIVVPFVAFLIAEKSAHPALWRWSSPAPSPATPVGRRSGLARVRSSRSRGRGSR